MSSDSTSWLRHASFGKIIIIMNGKTKTITTSNRKLDDPDFILNQSPDVIA